MQFDNVQLNNGSIINFARGRNLLPIQVGNLTVNGTAATATLSGNTPGAYGIGVIVTNINGAGNTLNVNDGSGAAFNGTVASGVTLALQGGNNYTLANGFALNGTLALGSTGTTASATGLSGGLPMGNGAAITGVGTVSGATVVMNNNGTLSGSTGTLTLSGGLSVVGTGSVISAGAVSATTTIQPGGQLTASAGQRLYGEFGRHRQRPLGPYGRGPNGQVA